MNIPKLTVIVRTDLGSGARVSQAVHGARLFAAEHAQTEHEWYTKSNTIVILGAKDEAHLKDLADKADYWDIQWSLFHEPDLQDQATCLVLAPSPVVRKICRGLPLIT